ncbi:MAG: hypothetical protein JWQ09_5864 [Segetibacter sp.]|nr:hypothetical protein [Segetibacter sp.]
MDIAVNTESAFGASLVRRYNTWYSVCDGNWSNANTWISNALDKRGIVSPQVGDNVYISHNVTLDINATVNNLYIQQKLSCNGLTLSVSGDLQANGTVDFTGSNTVVNLYGYNNFINTFISGSSSTVNYAGQLSQSIMPLNYWNLGLVGNNMKYINTNTIIGGNLSASSTGNAYIECGIYDLTVNGQTLINAINPVTQGDAIRISKTGSGALLFKGNVVFGHGLMNLPGNPSIEFQGGVQFLNLPATGANLGTGQLKFTTNNQNINNCIWTLTTSILISGAITVTNMNFGSVSIPAGLYIQGDNAASAFVNSATLNMFDATAPLPLSTTMGVFTPTATGSILGFMMASNYTLPYTSFQGLIIGGTGIKSLPANTTIAQSLSTPSTASLECGTFDLTINGTTNLSVSTGIKLRKSGAGTILFIGYVTFGNGTVSFPGNPVVEFRGGCRYLSNGLSNDSSANFGTGGIKFTTNNQNLDNFDSFDAPILISGSITVTAASNNFPTTIVKGVINGDNANSIWINNMFTIYNNATAPMAIGKLYCNQAANTFVYGLAGNQDITTPTDPVSPGYQNLTLNGSGAKRLLGNVSVKGVYTLTAPATLNLNGFALTNP